MVVEINWQRRFSGKGGAIDRFPITRCYVSPTPVTCCYLASDGVMSCYDDCRAMMIVV